MVLRPEQQVVCLVRAEDSGPGERVGPLLSGEKYPLGWTGGPRWCACHLLWEALLHLKGTFPQEKHLT